MSLQGSLYKSECDGVIHRSEDGCTVIVVLPRWADPRWLVEWLSKDERLRFVSLTPADSAGYNVLVALFRERADDKLWDWFLLRIRHVMEYYARQRHSTPKNGEQFTLEDYSSKG